MSGKAQSSLLIILGIVSVIIVGWFYASFQGVNLQRSSALGTLFTKIAKHVELIQGFSRNAAVLSAERATQIVAEEKKTFYCGSFPTPPATKQVRYELSSKTLDFLNEFLNNYKVSDPLLTVEISKYSCADIPVDEYRLPEGDYDEGFKVDAYGSRIKVTSKENSVDASNDVFEYVPQDRFFLLYRRLKDWAEKRGDSMQGELCNCLSNSLWDCPKSAQTCDSCPPFGSCIKKSLDSIASEIQSFIGDKYITCVAKPICCYGQRAESCLGAPQAVCMDWKSPYCNECYYLPNEEPCGDKIKAAYECQGSCEYWEKGYMSIQAQFTCTDRKYQLSIPSTGDRYLEFTFQTMVAMQKNGINYQSVPCGGGGCKCPENSQISEYCTQSCAMVFVEPVNIVRGIVGISNSGGSRSGEGGSTEPPPPGSPSPPPRYRG